MWNKRPWCFLWSRLLTSYIGTWELAVGQNYWLGFVEVAVVVGNIAAAKCILSACVLGLRGRAEDFWCEGLSEGKLYWLDWSVLTWKGEASRVQLELQNWKSLFSIISRPMDTCWMMCCSQASFSSNNLIIMQTSLYSYVGTRDENPFYRAVTLRGKHLWVASNQGYCIDDSSRTTARSGGF